MNRSQLVQLTPNAINRIKQIQHESVNYNKFLRLTVKGGGCSGFQYVFELDDKELPDDLIICENNDKIIAKTDKVSENFIINSQIDYVEELGASYFKVINPNASANCGCGASFSG
jgi:iron-sulfur cluster assembly accessory protein